MPEEKKPKQRNTARSRKRSVVENRDMVFASVLWNKEKLRGLVWVRRNDLGVAMAEMPSEIVKDFQEFGVAPVLRHAELLNYFAWWMLPRLTFALDYKSGKNAVREGPDPAELGSIRCFGEGLFAVDIGEFSMSAPCLTN